MEFELKKMNFTAAGLNLHSKIMVGQCPLKITRVVIGSAYLDEGDDPRTFSTVKSPVEAVVDIIDKQNIGDGAVCITVRINSGADDFDLREIAIMAQDPDNGEIMYHYCNYGDSADHIITYGGTIPITQEADIFIAIGDAEKLVVDITDISTVSPKDLRDAESALNEKITAETKAREKADEELQQIITDRTRVIISREDAARTENNALYLLITDGAADINAVAYDNAEMSDSEPSEGDNWLKVNTAAKIADSGRIVIQHGKLAVLKEPQGDETFLSK